MKKLYFNLNSNLRNVNLGQIEKGDYVELEITLLQGVDYSNASFRLLAEKVDNNKVEQKDNYTLLEEKITFKLKKEFLSYPGIVKMELNISDKGKEYTTSMFYIRVSDTINSNIIESIEDVETLKDLENYIENANNTLNQANKNVEKLEAANNNIIPNEEQREAAEAVRKQDEKFRTAAEKDRIEAEKLRNTNEEDRINTEEERVLNEETRKNNELNRKTAENLRVKREDAREQAEVLRQELFEENESVRNENENTRIVSENKRVQAEKLRQANEEDRILQEEARNDKEDIRESNEATRIDAERIREQQEANREQHYNDFNEAERDRIKAERNREVAEQERIEAERNRENSYQDAENDRNSVFEEAERNRSRIYNVAEDERAENERSRVIEESKRNIKEDSRVQAEKNRATAENLRVEAENERVTSEEERRNYIENTVKTEVKKIEEFGSQVTKNTKEIDDAKGEYDTLETRLDKENEKVYETINAKDFLPFEGENVTVEHSKVGYTKDMVIEGRTLQNLAVTSLNLKRGAKASKFDYSTGKILTTIFNYNSAKQLNGCYVFEDGSVKNDFIILNSSENVRNGSIKHEFTLPEGAINFSLYYVDGGINDTIDSLIVLEGKITKEIPEYFEGIKSSGETESKISILSNSANFWNINNIEIQNEKGKASITGTNEKFTLFTSNYADGFYIKIKGKQGVTYKFSGNLIEGVVKNIRLIDIPSNTIFASYAPAEEDKHFGVAYTCSKDMDLYARLWIDGGTNHSFSNVYFGVEDKEGTLYKSDKKEILLPYSYGFKGFPNGAKDTTVMKEDGLYIRKKIEKIVLDGTQGEFTVDYGGLTQETRPNTLYFATTIIDDKFKNTSIICNAFADKNIYSNDFEGIELVKMIYGLRISINKNKLETQDTEGFKKWLSQNPVTVYYELETPIEYKIEDLNSLNLETYKDVTYITSENSISPSLSFKAPVDVPATISTLRSANTMLSAQNTELQNKNEHLEEVNKKQTTKIIELDDTTSFLIEDALTRKLNN